MRIIVHPLFIITAFVAVFFATTGFFISLTVAVVFHELAHAIVAKYFGVIAERVTLTPFGGALNLNTKVLTPHQKIIIYLAGPSVSLMLSMFFGVLVWIFPTLFYSLEYLVAANFLVGMINILPIYPLDGGKILAQHLPIKIVFTISNIVFITILIFSLIFFNWWWIFFCVIMLLQINLEFKQNLYIDKFHCPNKNKTGKFVKCAVSLSMTLLSIYRMVDSKHPTEFVVVNDKNRIFYENDLEQWIIEHGTHAELKQCIK